MAEKPTPKQETWQQQIFHCKPEAEKGDRDRQTETDSETQRGTQKVGTHARGRGGE